MNLPISITLMAAILTALRVMCFAIAVLFVLLGLRGMFDSQIAIGMVQAVLSAVVFIITGFACGRLRDALKRRANGQ